MMEGHIRTFIETNEWTFARTMPTTPHEYTLRKNTKSEDDFLDFVRHIRSVGYDRSFGNRTYRYFDFDGWQYWTMGADLTDTIILNRARLLQEEVPDQRQ